MYYNIYMDMSMKKKNKHVIDCLDIKFKSLCFGLENLKHGKSRR